MNPTIEEVKKVAWECGAVCVLGLYRIELQELQAFAQHYIEVGRKEQRESDALVCMKMDGIHDVLYAEAIRNNTGE